jgi:putative ABC transport system ATP-binding protein
VERGTNILMITHDPHLAAYADRIVFMQDGKIVGEAPA